MALLAAVALMSAGALAFEVLLVRMVSIAQWHHFAHMIISIALLGFGASGTALTFLRERLLNRLPVSFVVLATLFGLTALAGFALSQAVPLNVLELAWDHRQQFNLLLVYLLLAVPFFCAGLAIGLVLSGYNNRIAVFYGGDLIGAGIGALAVIGGLFVVPAEFCLEMVGATGLVAAGLASWHRTIARPIPLALFAAAAALPVLWPNDWSSPTVSPYKELSLALTVPDAEIVMERSSPLGLLTVVKSPTIPFRYAPGLSLTSTIEPPAQLGVFTDATAMTAITRIDGQREAVAYLDQQTSALPYHLLHFPRVLILGAGGGSDVILARYHHAATIDAVDLNRQMVDLVRRDFADFAGHIFSDPSVRVHVAEARSFAANTGDEFDLVQIALLDSFTAAAAGLHALNESTLYTVEAFNTYLDRLSADGFLSITRWGKVPPRDGLKMFATAVKALQRRGIADPGQRLILIRGWRTVTMLVKNAPLTESDITAVRTFCRQRGFDIAYVPGLTLADVNRSHVWERPYLYEGAKAILSANREQYFDSYRFDVRPTTDDRPYFFHVLKARTLFDLLTLGDKGGLNLVEWGYPVLIATLGQAVVTGAMLILLPLIALRGRTNSQHTLGLSVKIRTCFYFSALGLAFMFIEMAFIQRLQLFLGHPLYAVSAALSGFLLFAGLGSICSRTWRQRLPTARHAIVLAATAIVSIALLYIVVLPYVFGALSGLDVVMKIISSLLLIAPLAFFMGMPFPIGLAQTAKWWSAVLVPWAWGINGCASVISTILATVLAIHLGFSMVVLLAAALYAIAAVALPVTKNA